MTAFQDDFEFFTVGTGQLDFGGYNSDADPTEIAPNLMVGGTQNVYKKNRGNIAVRPGLKRYLTSDPSLNGVKASYEWETSFAQERIIRVLADGKWQVLNGEDWITIQTFDKTRFVFTTWWDEKAQQELLIMVNGDSAIYAWSGGLAESVGTINTAGVLISGSITAESISATGSPSVIASNNTLPGTKARSAYVLDQNPAINEGLLLSIAQAAGNPSTVIGIAFVNDVSGSPSTIVGRVLIGASKEATAANLLGFLQNPGASNATQRGITDTNALTAIGDQTYTATDSLATADGTNWSAAGFTNGYPQVGNAFISNGITYTYTLIGAKYLINISGAPAPDNFLYQTIITNDPPKADFACDFVATITNQLIAGSYSSPVVYFSAGNNFDDFSNGGDLVAGDPDNIILHELPKGVIVVQDSVYIPAGNNAWYICTPNTPLPIPQDLLTTDTRLVIIEVQKKIGAAKTAALAQEFLGSIADTIVYVGQDHQLRMFGVFKDLLGTKFPTVSIDIKQELIDTDFTGGQLRAVGDNIYLVAPVPGIVFTYQQRDDVGDDGNILSQRIWQPPFTWNISRIALINGLEYGYSNQSPEQYQLWDTNQYHDDTPSGISPYSCVLRMGYWQFKDRTKLGDLDKVFIEGYMPANTNLICTLRIEYLGATAIEDIIISAEGDSPVLYQPDGVLVGDKLVGQSLVGGAMGLTGIPKFRCIADFKKYECFEYQLELHSNSLDSQWEVLCLGANGSQVVNKPVYLRKG